MSLVLASLLWLCPAHAVQDPIHDLAATFHVAIEEVKGPLAWHGDDYWVRGKPASPAELTAYEPVFVKEWSLYPPSYVQKAHLHRIVFAAALSMDGQLRAAVPACDADTMYYDPALGSYDPHYQRAVIHHEFFHFIDSRMKSLTYDPEWAKLNPTGFHYGSGGAQMRTSGVGRLTDKIPGFLTLYGTSAIEEDKAELFAHMVVDGAYVKDRAGKDPVLAQKIALLRSRLSNFDPAMGDEFWKKIPGWETQSPEPGTAEFIRRRVAARYIVK
jgi:hypothetical protein